MTWISGDLGAGAGTILRKYGIIGGMSDESEAAGQSVCICGQGYTASGNPAVCNAAGGRGKQTDAGAAPKIKNGNRADASCGMLSGDITDLTE